MPIEKLSITMQDSVLAAVDARGDRGEANRSGVISRDLNRYYTALTYSRAKLRDLLSESELSLILDVTNRTWFSEPFTIQALWAEVSDGISLEGMDKKWKVDGKSLVEKVKNLDFITLLALADACERWWNRVSRGEQPDFKEALEG